MRVIGFNWIRVIATLFLLTSHTTYHEAWYITCMEKVDDESDSSYRIVHLLSNIVPVYTSSI